MDFIEVLGFIASIFMCNGLIVLIVGVPLTYFFINRVRIHITKNEPVLWSKCGQPKLRGKSASSNNKNMTNYIDSGIYNEIDSPEFKKKAYRLYLSRMYTKLSVLLFAVGIAMIVLITLVGQNT